MTRDSIVLLTAKAKLDFGDQLLVCGSVPQLGSWDASGAAEMTWVDVDFWQTELSVPCGVCIELKLVIRGQGKLSWLGSGNEKSDNVLLETSLGRKGGRGSRLLGGGQVPLDLQVSDITMSSDDARDETHESRQSGIISASAQQPVACTAVAMPEDSQPPPHITAAMLASNAAVNLGRKVTYATKTTTMTVVTIDGMADIDNNDLPLTTTPAVNMSGGRPDDVTTTEAFRKARKQNEGMVRLGCCPLAWHKPGAKKVQVSGSWDGWSRPLALEPLSNLPGFGLLLGLPPGEYECKFIVDGVWMASDEMERSGNNGNNIFCAGDSLVLPSAVLPVEQASLALAIGNS